jgi:threonine synthase
MVANKEKLSHFSYLQCSHCDKSYPADEVNSYASCGKCGKNVLLGVYEHLSGISPTDIDTKDRSMWRYFAMLPVFDRSNIVSLGEGFTPILKPDRIQKKLNLDHLRIKDESLNPTGSFKSRGMSMAISKAKELGIKKCIVPTAGNAGGAMSAYCAKAGMEAVVVMPDHTPEIFKKECILYGAELILEKGLISDCARRVAKINASNEYFDLSTLKEPYRLEGKKTLGFEIAEQMDWILPDVILYPTGGGTGLIGMWKAFHEMMDMGWIASKMPRMFAIQSENCQPIVETWLGRQKNADAYHGAATLANGLAVPRPFGEKLILQILHETNGFPIAVTEDEIIASVKEMAREEGMLLAPEGGALLAALKKLLKTEAIHGDDKILFLNTGSGYKYLDNLN